MRIWIWGEMELWSPARVCSSWIQLTSVGFVHGELGKNLALKHCLPRNSWKRVRTSRYLNSWQLFQPPTSSAECRRKAAGSPSCPAQLCFHLGSTWNLPAYVQVWAQPSPSAGAGYLYLFIFPLQPGEHLSRTVRLFLAVLSQKKKKKKQQTVGTE